MGITGHRSGTSAVAGPAMTAVAGVPARAAKDFSVVWVGDAVLLGTSSVWSRSSSEENGV